MWCKAEQNNQNTQAPPRSTPGIEDTNLVFEIDFNHQRPEARPELQDSQWYGFSKNVWGHVSSKAQGKTKTNKHTNKTTNKSETGIERD